MFTDRIILHGDVRIYGYDYLLLVNWLFVMDILWRGPQLPVSPDHIAEEIIGINFHLKCILHIMQQNTTEI
jgi:hypothetical protein